MTGWIYLAIGATVVAVGITVAQRSRSTPDVPPSWSVKTVNQKGRK